MRMKDSLIAWLKARGQDSHRLAFKRRHARHNFAEDQLGLRRSLSMGVGGCAKKRETTNARVWVENGTDASGLWILIGGYSGA